MSAAESTQPTTTVSSSSSSSASQYETADESASIMDDVRVSADSLDGMDAVGLVHDERAGAVSSFVGITRNTFQGKKSV